MRLFLTFIALFAASPAMAWGDYGHRTTAAIAMDVVRPETRAAIVALIRSESQLETPTCKLKTLGIAERLPRAFTSRYFLWDWNAIIAFCSLWPSQR